MTAVACAMQRVQARRNGRTHAVLAPATPRSDWVVVLAGQQRLVRLSEVKDGLEVALPDEDRAFRLDSDRLAAGPGRCSAPSWTASRSPPRSRRRAEGFRIRHRAARAHVLVLTPVSADLHGRLPPKKAADTSRLVLSPMPGLVVSVEVAAGQEVKAGETLCVIEAMKMQNIIRAERDGVVKAVNAKAGDSVSADEVLAEFA